MHKPLIGLIIESVLRKKFNSLEIQFRITEKSKSDRLSKRVLSKEYSNSSNEFNRSELIDIFNATKEEI